MFERRVETSATPHVTVQACLGGLRVRGDAEREIRLLVQDETDEVSLEREGESFSVTIPGDGTLICPPGSTLTIERVLGNLFVDGVKGPLALGTVHGNATLSGLGPVALERGLGNLSARGLAGDFSGEDVKGNARVRGVEGSLRLQQVAGYLVADDLRGGLDAELVRGNVRLGPSFAPGADYRVKVGGNLTLHLLSNANLRLALRAGGRVRSLVPGLSLETVEEEARTTLGGGEATLEADVRGNAILRSTEPSDVPGMNADWEELGAHIEWQVSQAMADLTTRLENRLAGVEADRIRRRVERATDEARRKAEQAAERARMRAERAERRWQRVSGERTHPKPGAASDEERLRVLRMVEEGQLTPEQASELLAALEGS